MPQIHVHNYETSGQITVVFCIWLFLRFLRGKLRRHESQTEDTLKMILGVG